MTFGFASPATRPDAAPQQDWLERYRGWRDRLLASPLFQRRAAAFAPTRWIARRRANALFDLCAGFVYSQVLLACVRLRLVELLLDRPQTSAEIAARCGMEERAARRLLDAAVSLELLERREHHRYGPGPLGAALAGNSGVAAMVEHHSMLYSDLQDPVALLRGASGEARLGKYWAYAGDRDIRALEPSQVEAYSALMAASLPWVASAVLDAYPVEDHSCVLDVGGGEGGFLAACAQRAPDLRLMLFDVPPVAARAREKFAAAGMAGRLTAFGGDFRKDAMPVGADLVTLLRVIHDHDDAIALAILRRVRATLPRDGSLLLAEPLAQSGDSARVGAAYFGFYLLAMGSGRARTYEEIRALLHEAGFRHIQKLAAAMPVCATVIHASGLA